MRWGQGSTAGVAEVSIRRRQTAVSFVTPGDEEEPLSLEVAGL